MLARALMALALCTLPGLALAANPCATGGRGIGGTGISGNGGIGGTGHEEDRGIGGTGHGEDRGIGGTGISDDRASGRRGIGGTGISDTGIIGTITGFASVCINGVEVHYDANTPIIIDGAAATAGDLKIGQVVAIAAEHKNGRLVAKKIAVHHAVSGPVSHIDHKTGMITVLGEQVRPAHKQDARHLRVGQPVAVSGLRRADGAIVASRIDIHPQTGHGAVTGALVGRVARIGRKGLVVGHTRVGAPPALRRGLRVGDRVRVSGAPSERGLRATKIQRQPRVPFDGAVARLSLEGFVARGRHGRALTVDGVRVTVAKNARIIGGKRADIRRAGRVLVSGRLTRNNRLLADVVRLPRTPDRAWR